MEVFGAKPMSRARSSTSRHANLESPARAGSDGERSIRAGDFAQARQLEDVHMGRHPQTADMIRARCEANRGFPERVPSAPRQSPGCAGYDRDQDHRESKIKIASQVLSFGLLNGRPARVWLTFNERSPAASSLRDFIQCCCNQQQPPAGLSPDKRMRFLYSQCLHDVFDCTIKVSATVVPAREDICFL
jgi:hypothetical protein